MNRRNGVSGFMIIELAMVTMIIGILVLMAFRYMGGTTDDAKRVKATMDMKEIADACQEYCSKKGVYPQQFSDLVAAGFFSGPMKSPFGTNYEMDKSYVLCPLQLGETAQSGGKIEALSKLYNPVLLYDEFDDRGKSELIWDPSSNFDNLDFEGAQGNENMPGTYVKADSTVLKSKAPMPAGDFKIRVVIPSQKFNETSKKWERHAASVSFTVGSKVVMIWNNTLNNAYAKIQNGTRPFNSHFAPDMKVHELRAKILRSKVRPRDAKILYYVDGRCLYPQGETVEFSGGHFEITLDNGTYIGNAEATITDR